MCGGGRNETGERDSYIDTALARSNCVRYIVAASAYVGGGEWRRGEAGCQDTG
jgi:hypothetical protein